MTASTGVILGLTGGIASGKSAAARVFAENGFLVIDADALSREIVAKPSKALDEITALLGEGCLDKSGELDRKKVAEIVFHDEQKRKLLESILHPKILALAIKKAQAFFKGGGRLAIIEATLIVEAGWQKELDGLIVVTAPLEVRLQRVIARDGVSREEAMTRVKAQTNDEERLKFADWMIENDSTLQLFEQKVKNLIDKLLQK